MPHEVRMESAAARELEKIQNPWCERIRTRIRDLAEEPRPAGVERLAGENNAWRIRVGDTRVIYEIHDGEIVVLVIRVADRPEVYRLS